MATLRDCRALPAACDYNVYRLGWVVDYTDPHNILADLFGTDSTNQYTGWDNLRYRELLELSLAEMEPAQRLEYLHEAERILVQDEVAILPLYFTNRLSLLKQGIQPCFGPLIAHLNLWNTICRNHPPADVLITAPLAPLPITDYATVQVDFSAPDENDDHTVVIDWGDTATTNTTGTGLTAIATHQYASAGVYTITVTVTDPYGGSAGATYQYVVIYDPNGGFVTGAGWIISPVGAYTPDPTLTGKATFGFVSKYQKGSNVPAGSTEFKFHVASMSFKSTSYDWLVVAGTKAQFNGRGTINGQGQYGFILSAIDGGGSRSAARWNKNGHRYSEPARPTHGICHPDQNRRG